MPAAAKVDHDEQYQEKRRELLRKASVLLNEQGARNFSLSRLADHLQITPAALYYYFKNKQDLLFECYAYSLDIADRALDHAVAMKGTALEKLEDYHCNYFFQALQELHPTMTLRDGSILQPAYGQKIRERRKNIHKRLRKLVADGIKEGSIAPCDPAITVIIWAGAITEMLRVYDPKGRISARAIAQQASAQLIRGLAAPQAGQPKSRLQLRKK